jgi:hypothetical protein
MCAGLPHAHVDAAACICGAHSKAAAAVRQHQGVRHLAADMAAERRRRTQHALGREHDAAGVAQCVRAAGAPPHERRVCFVGITLGAPHACTDSRLLPRLLLV